METIVYTTKKGNTATDSLKVAKAFGKRHDNVLRDIRTLMGYVADSEGQLKSEATAIFYPWTYTDGQGKERECFLMNRAGFVLLVMGFKGKKAAAFKEEYIAQFDHMEQRLRSLSDDAPALNPSDHLHRAVQVANSISINNHQYQLGGIGSVVEYNRQNCLLHTGKRPAEIKAEAKEQGLPAKFRTSAKEVLRHEEPETACAMSLADQLVRGGATLEQAAAISVQSKALFRGIMALGFRPAQLAA
jgi:Rha family phage regulatory protein